MKRRNFLKTLGIGVLAAPVAIEAIKGIEVPKTVPFKLETRDIPLVPEQCFNPIYITNIAPVKPSKAGEAIYIGTNSDELMVHSDIHMPIRYFDNEDLPPIYRVVRKLNEIDCSTTATCLPIYVYECRPYRADLSMTKEIPAGHRLMIGVSAFSPKEFV